MNKLLATATIMGGAMHAHQSRRMAHAERKQPTQVFKCGVKQIPHPEKAYKGGEDAYVMSDQVIAVADGVGGWNEVGVDPALFSRELCRNVWDEISQRRNRPKFCLNLKEILVEAVKKIKSKGSSTFVMAGLDPDT
jgi:protein phosphatase PTC7